MKIAKLEITQRLYLDPDLQYNWQSDKTIMQILEKSQMWLCTSMNYSNIFVPEIV